MKKDAANPCRLLPAVEEVLSLPGVRPAAHLGEQLGWAIEVRPIAAGCHQ